VLFSSFVVVGFERMNQSIILGETERGGIDDFFPV
jgi:hypothetical protein